MQRFSLILSIILASLVLSSCGAGNTDPTKENPGATGTNSAAAPGAETGSAAERISFSASDLNGNTVTDVVLAGKKLTILNIWGTYCGPCIQEMPGLGVIAKEYADRGVQVIGIVLDAGDRLGREYPGMVDTAQTIILQTGADYLHLLPSESLYDLYLTNVSAIPLTYFLDENGRVIQKYLGARREDVWKTLIESALKEGDGQ